MKVVIMVCWVLWWAVCPADATAVKIAVEEPSGVERKGWPVTSGIPMAQGALKDAEACALFAADGAEVPLQTEALARWPDGSIRWVQADLRQWDPSALDAAPDVVVSNATLQWVPGHLDLIARVVRALTPGGWFAMQVPDNFDAPSHALMRDAASAHRRSTELLPAVSRLAVEPPATYLELLAGLGCRVDVWSTTYLHVLDPGGEVDDPVLEWVRGTGLRPVLAVLTDPDEREEFLADYRARLRDAYPRTGAGVVMPFRRTFAVARTGEA